MFPTQKQGLGPVFAYLTVAIDALRYLSMNHSELERLIRLSQKTGDTLIVADPQGSQSVVVMPIEKYEAMMEVAMDDAIPEIYDNLDEGDFAEMMPEPGMEAEFIPDLPVEEETAAQKKSDDFSGEEERFYLEPVD